ncbi:BMP/retinoic acid-inducible neural-specific protein 1-like [Sinocyclocheilus grahami]|uniref:BMP/retinoic acid-inducible neural-specific protein 1-like n=1 Tax=Sinocyclocheilus grahami TaxID=75366 RepID=UPI0007AD52EA|nr:PREDICTED: BMP/retinoic acid-inducible neural-specific protein 1-like [Sinocyclocheilus grahami]
MPEFQRSMRLLGRRPSTQQFIDTIIKKYGTHILISATLGVWSGLLCREFARWKVRNTAIERRDLIRNPLPLMPEFQRSMRLLGRRPSTQQFIDTIIKKYGTHILISATLGGEEALTMYMAKNKLDRKMVNATQGVEALHQLASSYFIDRDGTMRKLHEIQISSNAIKVTETRTGPLGCSTYDNLDSVSSVLLQSPESMQKL